ncbi:Cysteine dioxygenase type I [Geodermatophilus dictyosporus]|uniref:Cysteine dioxygenase type I n=1 Tax=Geodermatophilus dictyosporus TaxID=1523247 RepID=A0A1I5JDK5_9ACTN|nr:cysteine dioxygenase family protein [Geodermatophilus dictyosporus]SFO70739.1 Cysteine dioxygenase type I [Geodermatophilus dictyosporus]
MTSLLSPARDTSRATARDTARATSVTALAAALLAVSDALLPRVEYRESSRWTGLLPAGDAADLLDPSLHADLAAAQVWLLTWLPGQGTPLHDHGGSAGAFAVVGGVVTEDVVGGRPGAVREAATELWAGRVRPFGPHHVHRVTNRGTLPAVSVHVYRPRLTQMTAYRLEAGTLLSTGTEQAGFDW